MAIKESKVSVLSARVDDDYVEPHDDNGDAGK